MTTINIKDLDIPEDQKAALKTRILTRSTTIIGCDLCGSVFETRDIRMGKIQLCPDCKPYQARAERFGSKQGMLGQAEKKRLLSDKTTRVGGAKGFFNPNAKTNKTIPDQV